MQLRKTNLLFTALFAASLALTACGDDAGGDGNALCAQDSECGDNEICSAGFCMQTCTTAADCPDSNKNCVAQSATSTQKVCKCQTDALCQGDSGNTDLKCDASSGACTTTGTGPGPGPTSCTGTGQAACSYGSHCVNSTCTALTTGTCSNIQNVPTSGPSGYQPKNWTPATGTGPVIYDVTKVSYAPDTAGTPFCGTADTVKVRVKAYASTANTFPTSKDALGNLFYAKVDPASANGVVEGRTLIRGSEYTASADGKTAEFTMNFCPGGTSTNQIQIGLYFVGGNGYCATIQK